MAILNIQFTSEQLKHDFVAAELLAEGSILQLEGTGATSPGNASSEVHSATVGERVYYLDFSRSIVYRALLDNSIDVVLKFGLYATTRDNIESEAGNYRALEAFWGSVVPWFYGFYKGHNERGDEISCLVLEYAGELIHNLPKEERRKILTKLGELHLGNVHLDDFGEHNVVHKDGEYRLVDLQPLKLHECKFTGDWKWNERHWADIGCMYLIVAGIDLQAWKPDSKPDVKLGGMTGNAHLYPSQTFIDTMCDSSPHMVASFNAMYFCEWMEDVRSYMDKNGIQVENDHLNEDLKAYAEMIKPPMPKTRAEAKKAQRKKLRVY